MNCFCIVPFTISTRPENICKIPPEHNQKMPSQSCGSPRLAPISGRSNKMCPGRGITLGLIIQNCHKAIATQKRMIYLPNFLSQALDSVLQVTAVLQHPTLGIVIRHHHPSQPASGHRVPCPGITALWETKWDIHFRG